jgi:4-hydroxy 2-oxovalerate aldolase
VNKRLSLLDCTLRDGGYYNNWNFSTNLVDKYLLAISKLPVDIVEVGYISINKKDNYGLHYHLNTIYLKKIKSSLRKNQKLCCMINAKEVKNHKDLISLLTKFENIVDIVRIAIDPHQIDFFTKIISKTQKKLKKISLIINLMYLSKWYKDINYSNNLIKKVKKVVTEVALVDSHGSLKPLDVYYFFQKIIGLNQDIKIGCHFHNNSGLALANTLSAIKAGCMIADATIKGMGRGAGNAEMELLLSIVRTKEINISSYEFDEILEEFQKLKNKLEWGSSFSYSFSASKGFSQSEMMDLLQNKRLEASVALKVISSKIKNNNNIKFENINCLKFLKKNTPILIGGAPSFGFMGKNFLANLKKNISIILSGSNAFKNYIKLDLNLNNQIILLLSGSEIKKIKDIKKINFMKKFKIDYLVIEKDFFVKEFNKINKKKIITSESVGLNPLLLAGKILIHLKINKLNLAFFDGDYTSEKGKLVMKETEESYKIIKRKIDVRTFTKSFLSTNEINLWNNDQFFLTN